MSTPQASIHPGSVLVIAAAGFIGFGVAKAFRRAGYFVYGLIRDGKKCALLQSNEIIPIVGDGEKIETYIEHIKACPVIIDCSNSMSNTEHPEKMPLAILQAIEEASKTRDPLLPPKVFIYTSGIMVYGHDTRIRDESWPISQTFYAKFRRTVETAVVHSPHICGIVIRPAWVFGGDSGPHANTIFQNPGKIVFKGSQRDRRYSWIHIDDLAEAYVLACLRSPLAQGHIFNISNNYDTPIFADLVLHGARMAGYKGEITWEKRESWTDELGDATVLVNCQKATTLLGFVPKVFGLMDNLEFYFQCYLANKTLHEKILLK